jgi:hypothetical protein
MDKRKFLKSTLAGAGVLGLPAAAATTGNRLYGMPGSVIPIMPVVADKIRLTLSRLNLPVTAWQMLVDTAAAIQEFATSTSAQKAFASSPSQYFAERGLPEGSFAINSRELAMTRLAVDDVAQRAARSGDYPLFVQRLKDLRVGTIPNPDGLIARTAAALKTNVGFYETMKAAIGQTKTSDPQALAAALTSPSAKAVIMPGDTVAIDTDVLVFETVIAMIDVVIGAEVLVLAAAIAAIVIIVSGVEGPADKVYDPKLARLDGDLLEFAANATTGARLLGNRDFEVTIAKEVVRREIDALISASEAVGLISTTPEVHGQIIDLAFEKACEGLGLS